MSIGREVKARRHHLAEAAELHLGHFFRPLIHEQDEQLRLGEVAGNTLGDGLQDHRLARLGGSNNHGALALADRAEQVDDTIGVVWLAETEQAALELDTLLGVRGAQLVEVGSAVECAGILTVDAVHPAEGRTLVAPGRLACETGDLVAGPQSKLLDHLLAYVDVVPGGLVAMLAESDEPDALAGQLQYALEFLVAHRFRFEEVVRLSPWVLT